MTPSDLYRAALKAIDEQSTSSQGGRLFADLSPEGQDAILSDLEGGKLDLGGADVRRK
ncbi:MULTISPECIES: gluconate 2-dehydrogenase subunit 3 family protein [unclassified Mesorhizobium]|uniref:gluconate 2-dehydrogenase subunit 3 family protein n=1 Tax=unclassified Mesorhizobium TaxID=325217 RepID=UPI000FDA668C|nr:MULTISPECIES: gluconate 2-dehydrogenase subunit 3 family protein [unclassified Mesorhizobium]TGT71864.1 hypothetical protein EN809_016980 [Mesorhizobium sp. M2E.F.Ca.ET.166.01.1.1]TGV99421.1 hypothetical protein EN797_024275 [Mesorhizobium sp. M2E.F.Ca.ET.154.01.1.1]